MSYSPPYKLLRSKSGTCHECGAAPPSGHKFSTCGGCKVVSYCTKECQKKDWKTHKVSCRRTQKLHAELAAWDRARDPTSSLPPVVRLAAMLREFHNVHQWSIEKAVYSMTKSLDPLVDYEQEFLCLNFTYNPDWDGNPAKAFRLADMELLSFKRWMQAPNYRESWEAGKATREKELEAWRKSSGERLIASFSYMMFVQDCQYGEWLTMPILRVSPQFEAFAAEYTDHSQFVQTLGETIAAGVVYECVDPSDQFQRIGEMVKAGKNWKFQPFSAEWLRSAGLPDDFKIYA